MRQSRKYTHISLDISKASTGVCVTTDTKKGVELHTIQHPYRNKVNHKDFFIISNYINKRLHEILRKHDTENVTFSYEFPLYTAQSTAIQVFLTESILQFFYANKIGGFGISNSTVKSTALTIYRNIKGIKYAGVSTKKKSGVLSALEPLLEILGEHRPEFKNSDEVDAFLVSILGKNVISPLLDTFDLNLKKNLVTEEYLGQCETIKDFKDETSRAKKSKELNKLYAIMNPIVSESFKDAQESIYTTIKKIPEIHPLSKVLKTSSRFFKEDFDTICGKHSARFYNVNKYIPTGYHWTVKGVIEE